MKYGDSISDSLKMNNGLTSVVLSVLALSGSALARTEREKDLVTWLATRDQAIYGIGTVGFDLSEIPWTHEQFEAEKHFVLKMIDAARTKLHWELLSYQPHEEWVMQRLEKLAGMIEHFKKDI